MATSSRKKQSSKPRTRKRVASERSSRSARSTTRNGSQLGTYTVPRGDVSVAVPPFWTLRQTNEDLEVESPGKTTSVIVTVFKDDGSGNRLDAREYLQHFLETAHTKRAPKLNGSNRTHAKARFRDPDGDIWHASVLANKKTLLFATCNSSLPSTGKEAKLGIHVLESLKLKSR